MRSFIAVLCFFAFASIANADIMVFAPDSTDQAIKQLAATYGERTGNKVKVTSATTSLIARKIEKGAGADVFISANSRWMDYLDEKGFIRAGTRVTPFSNSLVLISAEKPEPIEIRKGLPLADLLGEGRLAMGEPDYVPVGSYARQALSSLGVWEAVADQTVFARDVGSVLDLVENGECPYGIVYSTSVRHAQKAKVVGEFPRETHAPILYRAAVVDGPRIHEAWDFIKFIRSEEGMEIIRANGFLPETE